MREAETGWKGETRKSPESEWRTINVPREKERKQQNPRANFIGHIKPSSHAVSNTEDYDGTREKTASRLMLLNILAVYLTKTTDF